MTSRETRQSGGSKKTVSEMRNLRPTSEEEALSICFANLKGSKQKDLLATAYALSYLKELPQYSSDVKLGKRVGVSREIVGEFLTLLRLPQDLHPLFERNELKLEQGRKLWQLSKKRPDLAHQVAGVLVRLTAMDSRDLVEYLLKHPEVSVEEAEDIVAGSKTVIEREFHVIALLSSEEYAELRKASHGRNIPVDRLVTSIVQDWLRTNSANDRIQ